MNSSPKVCTISNFIVKNFHNLRRIPKLISIPLIVGINGPQGCGKTTIVNQIIQHLKNSNNLSVVGCSSDDFYLTFNDQCQLALSNPGNKLLEFRGEPGTHDIALGKEVLSRLYDDINNPDKSNVNDVLIPFYDKSLKNGRGDRANVDRWNKVSPPFDIILFEGWSLGFKHLSKSQLEKIYFSSKSFTTEHDSSVLKLVSHSLSHLLSINENLQNYEKEWYKFFDIFVHIDANDINYVYQWRLEQERNMKSLGNGGMTDEQVIDFIDRYMPSYELYLPKLRNQNFFCENEDEIECKNHEQHYGRHLKLVLDIKRELVNEILM
ncbi:P-loop containing nucleoside triphosphate hydrolase protein [Gigaspora rosea]|uniref:P-loop containing nucleoside triphosphate hydrolase protein n=1 Tax=Gigaspora rosea TaxID=44941 RepID=A0A397UQ57_9GLOM|nr:P-loop containing nucleoside triphosphate hydrolase protein [Gigaspora rosea]